MKTLSIVACLFLANCMGAVATAITLGASAYASVDAYARATSPPEKIYDVPKRGGRMNKLVYADDERIPYWCGNPEARARIEAHCYERDARVRAEEANRQETLQQAEKDNAIRAENTKIRDEVAQTLKKVGLNVVFDRGLGMTIVEIRSGEKRLNDLKKTAIELYGDNNFVVFQVVNQNNVLFKDGSTDALVWLKDYARAGGKVTWLEGARLTAMEAGYVVIRGTKEYRTLLGTKQAVVIEAVF